MFIYNFKINGTETFKIIGSFISIIVICIFIFSIYKIESEDYYIKTEFNDENDFLNRRPANGVFTQGTIYMPGTAYNLNFVIKGD